ncbi:ammonium transporter [Nakamurella antarctica]|uniref:Ammonium transporter n=1 Tax=Nakamurella antarctica TaxID=1902245 RepID=A0A3G8ZM06_9ACTN|nr:ammonium transporter [Nakamurella antarctica]AZI57817.1 ammonium transporter [Nakamurella antarctica]
MDASFAVDTGNTAFMILAASLVLLMTPGLAFFYGGMTRSKSVLNMMMMSFGAMGIVGLIYVLWGYSMSFGTDIGGIIANPFEFFGLVGLSDAIPTTLSDGTAGVMSNSLMASTGVPAMVAVGFQLTFAVITVALISGSLADRVKFATWMVFAGIWVTIVYFPIAHMVWGGGILSGSGFIAKALSTPIDFAGGTVVHINAGTAALVLALVIGKRKGFGKDPMKPHNLPLVMIGAALLWFGWFGFNAGSEFGADGTAGQAWINTTVATAVAMLGWLIVEKLRDGHATSLGGASGVVAGLVAITPAAAAVDTIGAIFIGLIAGAVCALAVGLKYRFGYDDSLDVVGVHLVGGLLGTVLIGFFAHLPQEGDSAPLSTFAPAGAQNGLFYGGGATQLLTQTLVALVSVVVSGVLTYIIAMALKATMGWRISDDDEAEGIDVTIHGEQGYDLDAGGGSGHGVLTSSLTKSVATLKAQL